MRFLFLLLPWALFSGQAYVLGGIKAELGNNLFQVATASALAWDNNAEAHFPELVNFPNTPFNPQNIPLNYNYVFFRCNITDPGPPSCDWEEPTFAYHAIPYRPNMKVNGYFQSEKYFKHHRDRILKLYAPHPDVLGYILENYSQVIDHPCSVGVQIRDFGENDPHVQYGKDYLRKAAALFPKNALFVVSSNNMSFARKAIPEELENVVYVDDEHYISFYLLTLCKHNVITNSTFGWWTAWLNQNPEKVVIVPKVWYRSYFTIDDSDIVPDEWTRIEAKCGPDNDADWNS